MNLVTERIGAHEHRNNRTNGLHEHTNQSKNGPKLTRREARIRKRISAYGFLNMRYQKKYPGFFVYSDTPFEIEKLHDTDKGGEYETETMVIQNPVTKKAINYIERERVAKTKETGYGARSKVYLIQSKGPDGVETGQIRIAEFDRNLNVLGETVVSEYSQSYNNVDLDTTKQDVARESAKKEQYGMKLVLLEADVKNFKLSSKKIASMYKQQDIRGLADVLGIAPASTDEKTINRIREHLVQERMKNRTRTHRVKSKSTLSKYDWDDIAQQEDAFQKYKHRDGKPKTFTEMEAQEEKRMKEMEELLS